MRSLDYFAAGLLFSWMVGLSFMMGEICFQLWVLHLFL